MWIAHAACATALLFGGEVSLCRVPTFFTVTLSSLITVALRAAGAVIREDSVTANSASVENAERNRGREGPPPASRFLIS